MSTNLSKQKREDLLNKIEEIRKYLKTNLYDENTRKLTGYLNELTAQINGQKYGLVFEEHKEAIDEKLENNLPVLTEEKELFVGNGGEMNFLLEGDNLASLQLLEKTHKGKIDVIYIDPPYNTGNSFIYDDHIIDETDSFKHSKYSSFIYERLDIAKKLLSENGFIFISIDDKELSVMRLICDEIFGEQRFLTTIGWEKRTKCQNTKTARKMLQPKIEYILVYRSFDTRAEFNCHVIGEKEYPDSDENGVYRLEEIGQMGASGVRGRGSMIFPILGILPREGNQWKLGTDTIKEFQDRGDLLSENGKVYRKIRPTDESAETIKPFWALFSAEQFGTAESAKTELSKILGTKEHGFETVKTIQMIEELIFQSTNESSIILDFFAGSGTTAQAVLECNKDYGGHRKFILCTNNENGICRDITYERLKTVITGERKDGSKYSDGLSGSLKYFKVDFVEITEKEYYEYADKLLLHVRELVELENAVDFEHNKAVAIVLTEEELEEFMQSLASTALASTTLSNQVETNVTERRRNAVSEQSRTEVSERSRTEVSERSRTVYLGHDVLLSKAQKVLFEQNGISVKIIPQYYYPELNG